jgi:hypothetical protein
MSELAVTSVLLWVAEIAGLCCALFSVMRSNLRKILQSNVLGFANEIATENKAGEKKDTMAP